MIPKMTGDDRILEVTLISRVKYIFIITRECDLHFFSHDAYAAWYLFQDLFTEENIQNCRT